MADAESIEMLKSIVGDGVPDETLRGLLLRAGGDVSSAANSFFDGGVATLATDTGADFRPAPTAVGDDVLGTLFKTLEDQGRKLAGARHPARDPPDATGENTGHVIHAWRHLLRTRARPACHA